MSKRKYPQVNLNECPTIGDVKFGAIAARLAAEHFKQLREGTFDRMLVGNDLSTKIAKALKQFRINNKKK